MAYSGIRDADRAQDIRRGIYRCARHREISAEAGTAAVASPGDPRPPPPARGPGTAGSTRRRTAPPARRPTNGGQGRARPSGLAAAGAGDGGRAPLDDLGGGRPPRAGAEHGRLPEALRATSSAALGSLQAQKARAVVLRAAAGMDVWSAGQAIDELPLGGRDPLGYGQGYGLTVAAGTYLASLPVQRPQAVKGAPVFVLSTRRKGAWPGTAAGARQPVTPATGPGSVSPGRSRT